MGLRACFLPSPGTAIQSTTKKLVIASRRRSDLLPRLVGDCFVATLLATTGAGFLTFRVVRLCTIGFLGMVLRTIGPRSNMGGVGVNSMPRPSLSLSQHTTDWHLGQARGAPDTLPSGSAERPRVVHCGRSSIVRRRLSFVLRRSSAVLRQRLGRCRLRRLAFTPSN
jgi:hypothetical protein